MLFWLRWEDERATRLTKARPLMTRDSISSTRDYYYYSLLNTKFCFAVPFKAILPSSNEEVHVVKNQARKKSLSTALSDHLMCVPVRVYKYFCKLPVSIPSPFPSPFLFWINFKEEEDVNRDVLWASFIFIPPTLLYISNDRKLRAGRHLYRK